ncbi:GntR family transcriptional regulator [Alicyclobacillus cellulosilyticus]|uniref:GntR family transcriptional regulator n=1 Tax=Alicyclobacillus cellulosilyticus TaxID=1003997 RepID=A0A917K6Z3_9BACL|nr:GntR family transcriptional regulator [Alicyclobacillus cellulosilyticus]GGJ00474.1 GntR family transcriptional regulator [Alicyclobacillus cellulosilyticus]
MENLAFTKNYATKQEVVYQALRDAIIRGQLRPGERLLLRDLAMRFDVSPIPVREALRLLHVEGWIEHKPHVGAVVSPLSEASIVETFTLKEGLEGVAARVATERIGPGQLAELEAMWKEMDDILRREQYDLWGDMNERFHRSIASCTGMPLLVEMTERIMLRWQRIRNHFFKEVFVAHLIPSHEEHRAILDAMRHGAAAEAERLARAHNRTALQCYMAYLHGEPMPCARRE